VVPLVEEFFLRAFLMRFVVARHWWEVPLGKVDALGIIVGTVVPMLMHPSELLAAAVWFSLVTWLMLRTQNIWDCVAAHAITNVILGCTWFFPARGDCSKRFPRRGADRTIPRLLNRLARFWECRSPPPPSGRRLQVNGNLPESRNPI